MFSLVVSKKQLIDLLGLGNKTHQFRELLPYVAYTVSNGPFSNLYLRYGYDPAKDPSSRIYQQVKCKLNPIFLNEMNER
jgi:hypothetical protein